jgi:hypothetical protein
MSSTISSNPDIVDGPRKRLPSKRVTENGDLISNKKAKTSNAAKKTSNGTAASVQPSTKSVSRRASIEDISEPAAAPRPQPQAGRILEAADGTDDSDDPSMPALEDIEPVNWDSDDDDEDDDNSKSDLDDTTELSMTYIVLLNWLAY